MLVEAILGSDDALAAAAARTAMEMPGTELSAALVEALPKAPAERKGLLIHTLADRGEPQVLPAVLEAIKSNDDALRVLAFRTLKRVGNASCLPALLEAAASEDGQVAAAALEALEVLQDKAIDAEPRRATSDGQRKDAAGDAGSGQASSRGGSRSCRLAGRRGL